MLKLLRLTESAPQKERNDQILTDQYAEADVLLPLTSMFVSNTISTETKCKLTYGAAGRRSSDSRKRSLLESPGLDSENF